MSNTVTITNLSTTDLGAVFFSVIATEQAKTITDFPTVDIDNYIDDYDRLSTLGGMVVVDGALRAGAESLTATGTLADATRVVKVDTTSGVATVTLMPIANVPVGTTLFIWFAVDGGDLTLDGNAAEEIDGATTLVLTDVGFTRLQSDGTAWTSV